MDFVGVGLLAQNVQSPSAFRQYPLSFTSIASKLAPTGGTGKYVGCVNAREINVGLVLGTNPGLWSGSD